MTHFSYTLALALRLYFSVISFKSSKCARIRISLDGLWILIILVYSHTLYTSLSILHCPRVGNSGGNEKTVSGQHLWCIANEYVCVCVCELLIGMVYWWNSGMLHWWSRSIGNICYCRSSFVHSFNDFYTSCITENNQRSM